MGYTVREKQFYFIVFAKQHGTLNVAKLLIKRNQIICKFVMRFDNDLTLLDNSRTNAVRNSRKKDNIKP